MKYIFLYILMLFTVCNLYSQITKDTILLPEVILEAPDTGFKSVAYAELTSILVNAIKEQQVIIDDLKSRIETLEK